MKSIVAAIAFVAIMGCTVSTPHIEPVTEIPVTTVDRYEDNGFVVLEVAFHEADEEFFVDVKENVFTEGVLNDGRVDTSVIEVSCDLEMLDFETGEEMYQFSANGAESGWVLTKKDLGFTPKMLEKYYIYYSENNTPDDIYDDIFLMAKEVA